MFRSCTLNQKINCLHERCLRIVYNDKKSAYENLLISERSASVHVKNLQILATEMFSPQRLISVDFQKLLNKRTLKYDLHFQELKVFIMGLKVWLI